MADYGIVINKEADCPAMLINNRFLSDVKPSEITPKEVFINRRRFIQSAAMVGAGSALTAGLLSTNGLAATQERRGKPLDGIIKSPLSTSEEPTPYNYVTTYNNFYEFGTGKDDPAVMAGDFKPKPWKVTVGGEVGKPGDYDFDDLIKPHKLEERIYRFRCVEAWSMIVPWVGIPLADIIKAFEPTSRAKYVAFETLNDPERMPGQKRRVLSWPYVEGLRMDEAMNPLTLMAVGLYGEELLGQNGAPIRLVVPWKYGFKSIKSIVGIRLVETMPPTTWNRSAPREYGFYANVNPEVSHPRWSQAKERRLGGGYFTPKVETVKFNGYGEQVASLYDGMDLSKSF
jgi:sulfoxide reductase catalytic subunit YedY